MAQLTGDLEKINVRSPYYLTVGSGDTPEPYTPPTELTQIISCGHTSKVGADVGTRIYKANVDNRSGDFDIDFVVNIPVKISYKFTEDASYTELGYRGNLDFIGNLLSSGIPNSELTSLATGVQTFTVTATRATDADGEIFIKIEAPSVTDDYQFTLNCASETIHIPSVPNNPSLLLHFNANRNTSPDAVATFYMNGMEIGSVSDGVDSRWGSSTDIYIGINTLSTQYNLYNTSIPIINIDGSTIKDSQNILGIKFNESVYANIEFWTSDLFTNPSTSTLEWTDPNKYQTNNFYSYGSRNAVPTPFIPRVSGQHASYGSNFSFVADRVNGCHYNPTFEDSRTLQRIPFSTGILVSGIDVGGVTHFDLPVKGYAIAGLYG